MFRRGLAYLHQIDWADIIGSALIVAFCLLVFVPWEKQPGAPAADHHQTCEDYQARTGPGPGLLISLGCWIDSVKDDLEAASTLAVALFTMVLAASTIGLWRQTERLAERADDQARKMAESVELARKDFTAEHRPWVKASVVLAGDLTFGNSGAGLPVTITVTNTGRTPAMDVWPHIEAREFPQNIPQVQREFLEYVKADRELFPTFGVTIFPGDTHTIQHHLGVRQEDYFLRNMLGEGWFPSLPPLIIGCVSYKSSMDGSIHQTGFVASISGPNFLACADPVNQSDLDFRILPVGSYAD